ncbi:MAG TPA: SDR family NAD(P)-dependent oxidoreductase [Solirubrobacterales bacterium]|nr:SDR family NAD(P)-dependent oxidoreductase [Solirubrobacterales bacterium]
MKLNGKTTLLTGATGGLGRAIGAELASAGTTLILSARSREQLDQLAGELPGGPHRVVPADLSTEGAAESLAEEAGEFDVLIANAGVGGGEAIEENSAEAIKRVSRVNLEVPMLLAAAARNGMLERGDGHMVFISSLAGKAIPVGSALYAATKAGLRAFALGLRADLHESGVGVSSVNPGFVREAGMFHDSGGRPPAKMGTASPEDVARAVREAIENDRADVDVAPIQQKAFVNFAYHFHGLGKRIERALSGGR